MLPVPFSVRLRLESYVYYYISLLKNGAIVRVVPFLHLFGINNIVGYFFHPVNL